MNKKYILVFVGIAVAAFLFLRFGRHSQSDAHQVSPTNAVSSTQAKLAGVTEQQQGNSGAKPSGSSDSPPIDTNYIHKVLADPQYDWKQPINFYGLVVDESNAVVVGASVHFTWNNISVKGTADADTTSDSNGAFSLTDKRGKYLYVTVGKKGYYSAGNSAGSGYEYANPFDGLFHPDPMNPVVFHLRKKGVGVDLIVSHAPMSTFIRIAPPTNGSPVYLDFFSQKVGDSGQLKIEGWKEPKDFKTAQNNWGFRLTISDGGFVKNTDEFPFEAPDADYLPVVEWHFTNGTPDWSGAINKKYYIKFGNPPRYGKISVDTTAFSPGVHLEFAINPDGSRNLEPK